MWSQFHAGGCIGQSSQPDARRHRPIGPLKATQPAEAPVDNQNGGRDHWPVCPRGDRERAGDNRPAEGKPGDKKESADGS